MTKNSCLFTLKPLVMTFMGTVLTIGCLQNAIAGDEINEKTGSPTYFVQSTMDTSSNPETHELATKFGDVLEVIDSAYAPWLWVKNEQGDTGYFYKDNSIAISDADYLYTDNGIEIKNEFVLAQLDEQPISQTYFVQSTTDTVFNPDTHEIAAKSGDIFEVIDNSHDTWLWVKNEQGDTGYLYKDDCIVIQNDPVLDDLECRLEQLKEFTHQTSVPLDKDADVEATLALLGTIDVPLDNASAKEISDIDELERRFNQLKGGPNSNQAEQNLTEDDAAESILALLDDMDPLFYGLPSNEDNAPNLREQQPEVHDNSFNVRELTFDYKALAKLTQQEYEDWWEGEDIIAMNYNDAFPEEGVSEQKMLESITVNLVWLGKRDVEDNEYVFPSERENLNVAPYIKDWVEKGYKVNFWFDKNVSNANQIAQTEDLFRQLTEEVNAPLAQLSLKDIWTLDSVSEKPGFFSSSANNTAPVYLRADMLRLMISRDELEHGSGPHYSVYADLDIKALPVSVLMSKEQQTLLNNIGMVAARGGLNLDMENAFHVAARDKDVIKALTLTVEANFARFNNKTANEQRTSGQQVYPSYRGLFEYLYAQKGYGHFFNFDGTLNDDVSFDEAVLFYATKHNRDYINTFAATFSWSEGLADELNTMMIKDVLKDRVRGHLNSVVLYSDYVDEYTVVADEYEELERKITHLRAEQLAMDEEAEKTDIWNEVLQNEYDRLELNINGLQAKQRKLKKANKKLGRFLQARKDIERKKQGILSLKAQPETFILPYMWIPKMTVDRPASKNDGYN